MSVELSEEIENEASASADLVEVLPDDRPHV